MRYNTNIILKDLIKSCMHLSPLIILLLQIRNGSYTLYYGRSRTTFLTHIILNIYNAKYRLFIICKFFHYSLHFSIRTTSVSCCKASHIYIMQVNTHLTPRPILLTRHGESQYNVRGRIGGDTEIRYNLVSGTICLLYWFKKESIIKEI